MVNIESLRLLGGAAILACLGLSGCATEEYVDQKVAAVQGQVTQLSGETQTALKLANGKFNYHSDPGLTINFETGSAKLSDEETAKLAEFAKNLQAQDKNVYIEIEGFADPRGGKKDNRILGALRANIVADTLRANGVALNRMDVLSHGEDHPVSGGEEGMAEARRVQISVAQ